MVDEDTITKEQWDAIREQYWNRQTDLIKFFKEVSSQTMKAGEGTVAGLFAAGKAIGGGDFKAGAAALGAIPEGVLRAARDIYGMALESQNPTSFAFHFKDILKGMAEGRMPTERDWRAEVQQFNKARRFARDTSRLERGDETVFEQWLDLDDDTARLVRGFVDPRIAHGVSFVGFELLGVLRAPLKSARTADAVAAGSRRVAEGVAEAADVGPWGQFQNKLTSVESKFETFSRKLFNTTVGNALSAAGTAVAVPARLAESLIGGNIERLADASGMSSSALRNAATHAAVDVAGLANDAAAFRRRQTVGFLGSMGLQTVAELSQAVGREMASRGFGHVSAGARAGLTTLETVAASQTLSKTARAGAKFLNFVVDPFVQLSTEALKRSYKDAYTAAALGYLSDKDRGFAAGLANGMLWGGFSGGVRHLWSMTNGKFSHELTIKGFDEHGFLSSTAAENPDFAVAARNLVDSVDKFNSSRASANIRTILMDIWAAMTPEQRKNYVIHIGDVQSLRDTLKSKGVHLSAEDEATFKAGGGAFAPMRNHEGKLVLLSYFDRNNYRAVEVAHESLGHLLIYNLQTKGKIGEHLLRFFGARKDGGVFNDEYISSKAASRMANMLAMLGIEAEQKALGANRTLSQNLPDGSVNPAYVAELNRRADLIFNGDASTKGSRAYFQSYLDNLRQFGSKNASGIGWWVGVDKQGNPLPYANLPGAVDEATLQSMTPDAQVKAQAEASPVRFMFEEIVSSHTEAFFMFKNLREFSIPDDVRPFRDSIERWNTNRFARSLAEAELAGFRMNSSGVDEQGRHRFQLEMYEDGTYVRFPEMESFFKDMMRAATSYDAQSVRFLSPSQQMAEAKLYDKEFMFSMVRGGMAMKGTNELNKLFAQSAERAFAVLEAMPEDQRPVFIVDQFGNKSIDLLRINDAGLEALHKSGALDPETLRTTKAMRDAFVEWERTGYASSNVFYGVYWGASHRTIKNGFFHRLLGRDTPVTNRVFVPFELTMTHKVTDENGQALRQAKGGVLATVVDYMAIHRRKMAMWSRPDVRRTFVTLEAFNEAFDKYMLNMMKDPASRVPTVELFKTQYPGLEATVRDMLYETFGGRKRMDESYINQPREGYTSSAENPNYPIHSMKVEMLVGVDLMATRPFPYHHGNSYEPLRRNLSLRGFEKVGMQDSRLVNGQGYQIFKNGAMWKVYSPFGGILGLFKNLQAAEKAVNKDMKKMDIADLVPMPTEAEWADMDRGAQLRYMSEVSRAVAQKGAFGAYTDRVPQAGPISLSLGGLVPIEYDDQKVTNFFNSAIRAAGLGWTASSVKKNLDVIALSELMPASVLADIDSARASGAKIVDPRGIYVQIADLSGVKPYPTAGIDGIPYRLMFGTVGGGVDVATGTRPYGAKPIISIDADYFSQLSSQHRATAMKGIFNETLYGLQELIMHGDGDKPVINRTVHPPAKPDFDGLQTPQKKSLMLRAINAPKIIAPLINELRDWFNGKIKHSPVHQANVDNIRSNLTKTSTGGLKLDLARKSDYQSVLAASTPVDALKFFPKGQGNEFARMVYYRLDSVWARIGADALGNVVRPEFRTAIMNAVHGFVEASFNMREGMITGPYENWLTLPPSPATAPKMSSVAGGFYLHANHKDYQKLDSLFKTLSSVINPSGQRISDLITHDGMMLAEGLRKSFDDAVSHHDLQIISTDGLPDAGNVDPGKAFEILGAKKSGGVQPAYIISAVQTANQTLAGLFSVIHAGAGTRNKDQRVMTSGLMLRAYGEGGVVYFTELAEAAFGQGIAGLYEPALFASVEAIEMAGKSDIVTEADIQSGFPNQTLGFAILAAKPELQKEVIAIFRRNKDNLDVAHALNRLVLDAGLSFLVGKAAATIGLYHVRDGANMQKAVALFDSALPNDLMGDADLANAFRDAKLSDSIAAWYKSVMMYEASGAPISHWGGAIDSVVGKMAYNAIKPDDAQIARMNKLVGKMRELIKSKDKNLSRLANQLTLSKTARRAMNLSLVGIGHLDSEQVREMTAAGLIRGYAMKGGKKVMLLEVSDRDSYVDYTAVNNEPHLLPFVGSGDPERAFENYVAATRRRSEQGKASPLLPRTTVLGSTNLGKIFGHEELYRHVPELRDVRVVFKDFYGARYVPGPKPMIEIGARSLTGQRLSERGLAPEVGYHDLASLRQRSAEKNTLVGMLAHEVQHYLQDRAGIYEGAVEMHEISGTYMLGKIAQLLGADVKKPVNAIELSTPESVASVLIKSEPAVISSIRHGAAPMLRSMSRNMALFMDAEAAEGRVSQHVAEQFMSLAEEFETVATKEQAMKAWGKYASLHNEHVASNPRYHGHFADDVEFRAAQEALGLVSSYDALAKNPDPLSSLVRIRKIIDSYSHLDYLMDDMEVMAAMTSRRRGLSENQLSESGRSPLSGSILDIVDTALGKGEITGAEVRRNVPDSAIDGIMLSLGGLGRVDADNRALEALAKLGLIRWTLIKAHAELEATNKAILTGQGWEVTEDGKLMLTSASYLVEAKDLEAAAIAVKDLHYAKDIDSLAISGPAVKSASGKRSTYSIEDVCRLAELTIDSQDALSVGNSVMDRILSDKFPPLVKGSEIISKLNEAGGYTPEAARAVMLDSVVGKMAEHTFTKNDLLNLLSYNHYSFRIPIAASGKIQGEIGAPIRRLTRQEAKTVYESAKRQAHGQGFWNKLYNQLSFQQGKITTKDTVSRPLGLLSFHEQVLRLNLNKPNFISSGDWQAFQKRFESSGFAKKLAEAGKDMTAEQIDALNLKLVEYSVMVGPVLDSIAATLSDRMSVELSGTETAMRVRGLVVNNALEGVFAPIERLTLGSYIAGSRHSLYGAAGNLPLARTYRAFDFMSHAHAIKQLGTQPQLTNKGTTGASGFGAVTAERISEALDNDSLISITPPSRLASVFSGFIVDPAEFESAATANALETPAPVAKNVGSVSKMTASLGQEDIDAPTNFNSDYAYTGEAVPGAILSHLLWANRARDMYHGAARAVDTIKETISAYEAQYEIREPEGDAELASLNSARSEIALAAKIAEVWEDAFEKAGVWNIIELSEASRISPLVRTETENPFRTPFHQGAYDIVTGVSVVRPMNMVATGGVFAVPITVGDSKTAVLGAETYYSDHSYSPVLKHSSLPVDIAEPKSISHFKYAKRRSVHSMASALFELTYPIDPTAVIEGSSFLDESAANIGKGALDSAEKQAAFDGKLSSATGVLERVEPVVMALRKVMESEHQSLLFNNGVDLTNQGHLWKGYFTGRAVFSHSVLARPFFENPSKSSLREFVGANAERFAAIINTKFDSEEKAVVESKTGSIRPMAVGAAMAPYFMLELSTGSPEKTPNGLHGLLRSSEANEGFKGLVQLAGELLSGTPEAMKENFGAFFSRVKEWRDANMGAIKRAIGGMQNMQVDSAVADTISAMNLAVTLKEAPKVSDGRDIRPMVNLGFATGIQHAAAGYHNKATLPAEAQSFLRTLISTDDPHPLIFAGAAIAMASQKDAVFRQPLKAVSEYRTEMSHVRQIAFTPPSLADNADAAFSVLPFYNVEGTGEFYEGDKGRTQNRQHVAMLTPERTVRKESADNIDWNNGVAEQIFETVFDPHNKYLSARSERASLSQLVDDHVGMITFRGVDPIDNRAYLEQHGDSYMFRSVDPEMGGFPSTDGIKVETPFYRTGVPASSGGPGYSRVKQLRSILSRPTKIRLARNRAIAAAESLRADKISVQPARSPASPRIPEFLHLASRTATVEAMANVYSLQAKTLHSPQYHASELAAKPNVGFSWSRLEDGRVMLNFNPDVNTQAATNKSLQINLSSSQMSNLGFSLSRTLGWDSEGNSTLVQSNAARHAFTAYMALGNYTLRNVSNQKGLVRAALQMALPYGAFDGDPAVDAATARTVIRSINGLGSGANLNGILSKSMNTLSEGLQFARGHLERAAAGSVDMSAAESRLLNDAIISARNPGGHYTTLILPKNFTPENVVDAIVSYFVVNGLQATNASLIELAFTGNPAFRHENGNMLSVIFGDGLGTTLARNRTIYRFGREAEAYDPKGVLAAAGPLTNQNGGEFIGRLIQRMSLINPTIFDDLGSLYGRISESESGYFMPEQERAVALHGDSSAAIKMMFPGRKDLLQYAWDSTETMNVSMFKGSDKKWMVGHDIPFVAPDGKKSVRRNVIKFQTEAEANSYIAQISASRTAAEMVAALADSGTPKIESLPEGKSSIKAPVSKAVGIDPTLSKPNIFDNTGGFVVGDLDTVYPTAEQAKAARAIITDPIVASMPVPKREVINLSLKGLSSERMENEIRSKLSFGLGGSPVTFMPKLMRVLNRGKFQNKKAPSEVMTGAQWYKFFEENQITSHELRVTGVVEMLYANRDLPVSKKDLAAFIYTMYPETGRITYAAKDSGMLGVDAWGTPIMHDASRAKISGARRVLKFVQNQRKAIKNLIAGLGEGMDAAPLKLAYDNLVKAQYSAMERAFEETLSVGVMREALEKLGLGGDQFSIETKIDALLGEESVTQVKGVGRLQNMVPFHIASVFVKNLNSAIATIPSDTMAAVNGTELIIPIPLLQDEGSRMKILPGGELLGPLDFHEYSFEKVDEFNKELGFAFTGNEDGYQGYSSGIGRYWFEALHTTVAAEPSKVNQLISSLQAALESSTDEAQRKSLGNTIESIKRVALVRSNLQPRYSGHKNSPTGTMQLGHLRLSQGFINQEARPGASLHELGVDLAQPRENYQPIPTLVVEEMQSDPYQKAVFGNMELAIGGSTARGLPGTFAEAAEGPGAAKDAAVIKAQLDMANAAISKRNESLGAIEAFANTDIKQLTLRDPLVGTLSEHIESMTMAERYVTMRRIMESYSEDISPEMMDSRIVILKPSGRKIKSTEFLKRLGFPEEFDALEPTYILPDDAVVNDVLKPSLYPALKAIDKALNDSADVIEAAFGSTAETAGTKASDRASQTVLGMLGLEMNSLSDGAACVATKLALVTLMTDQTIRSAFVDAAQKMMAGGKDIMDIAVESGINFDELAAKAVQSVMKSVDKAISEFTELSKTNNGLDPAYSGQLGVLTALSQSQARRAVASFLLSRSGEAPALVSGKSGSPRYVRNRLSNDSRDSTYGNYEKMGRSRMEEDVPNFDSPEETAAFLQNEKEKFRNSGYLEYFLKQRNVLAFHMTDGAPGHIAALEHFRRYQQRDPDDVFEYKAPIEEFRGTEPEEVTARFREILTRKVLQISGAKPASRVSLRFALSPHEMMMLYRDSLNELGYRNEEIAAVAFGVENYDARLGSLKRRKAVYYSLLDYLNTGEPTAITAAYASQATYKYGETFNNIFAQAGRIFTQTRFGAEGENGSFMSHGGKSITGKASPFSTSLGTIMAVAFPAIAEAHYISTNTVDTVALGKQLDAAYKKLRVTPGVEIDFSDTIPLGYENAYRGVMAQYVGMRALQNGQRAVSFIDARHHRARYHTTNEIVAVINLGNGKMAKLSGGQRYLLPAYVMSLAKRMKSNGDFFTRLMTDDEFRSKLLKGESVEHAGATANLTEHIFNATKEALVASKFPDQRSATLDQMREAARNCADLVVDIAQSEISEEGLTRYGLHKFVKAPQGFLMVRPWGRNHGYNANYGSPYWLNSIYYGGGDPAEITRLSHDVFEKATVTQTMTGTWTVLAPNGKVLFEKIATKAEAEERAHQTSKYLGGVGYINAMLKTYGKMGAYATTGLLQTQLRNESGETSGSRHPSNATIDSALQGVGLDTRPGISDEYDKMRLAAGTARFKSAIETYDYEGGMVLPSSLPTGESSGFIKSGPVNNKFTLNNQMFEMTHAHPFSIGLHALGVTMDSKDHEIAAASTLMTGATGPTIVLRPFFPTAAHDAAFAQTIAEGLPLLSLKGLGRGAEIKEAMRIYNIHNAGRAKKDRIYPVSVTKPIYQTEITAVTAAKVRSALSGNNRGKKKGNLSAGGLRSSAIPKQTSKRIISPQLSIAELSKLSGMFTKTGPLINRKRRPNDNGRQAPDNP